MFKSAISNAAQASVLIVVTSVGAIALRVYCLACLVAGRVR